MEQIDENIQRETEKISSALDELVEFFQQNPVVRTDMANKEAKVVKDLANRAEKKIKRE